MLGVTGNPAHGEELDDVIEVLDIGFLEQLLANVALQLFAYHVANEQGRSIDKPRNLAKSVTADRVVGQRFKRPQAPRSTPAGA